MSNEATLIPFDASKRIEELEKAFEAIKRAFDEFIQSKMQPTFEELFEQLKGVSYTPKKPIPKTPYSFRTKARTIFKRLKIYHIRSNCRKER